MDASFEQRAVGVRESGRALGTFEICRWARERGRCMVRLERRRVYEEQIELANGKE